MRRHSSGQFDLPIPASEAIDYFTPEGERAWAPGWNPIYPAGEVSESPGTAFITEHDDTKTFWIIEKVDRQANEAAYSRITPGHHAGVVRVRCEDVQEHSCLVHVAYDEESFTQMLKDWRQFVGQALTQPRT